MSSSLSLAPTHPNLVVQKRAGSPKVRKSEVVVGVSPPIEMRIHNNDINTLERAVKERVFFVKDAQGQFVPPPKPASDAYFSNTLQPFLAVLRRHLPSTTPILRQQFVDSNKGRKHLIYQRAYESLCAKPFVVKDSYIKAFVKVEKMNVTKKPDPVPRVIQPRSPRFNVEVGRYLRPIEERIYEAIADVYGEKTVVKGINALESGRLMKAKWDKFKNPVAVGLDASRFDQHVSQSALKWEHSVYLMCFFLKHHKDQLARLLRLQLINKCFGAAPDGELQYTTDGCRMSGDMNTGLGNCLLMCAMIYCYMQSRGIHKFSLANNGDDCVVFMEREDLATFSENVTPWFLTMGFNMVVEAPVYELEQIEFCQTKPVWVGPAIHDYIMVRNPEVGICKDTVSLIPHVNRKVFLEWLGAIGEGGLALAGGVPVWQEFYALYSRSSKGYCCKDRQRQTYGWGVRQMINGMRRGFGPISDKTRLSFWLAFGITPDAQICIEQYFRSLHISQRDDARVYQYGAHMPY